jgi:hypothetical protein
VQVLYDALLTNHYDTWIDWQDIAPISTNYISPQYENFVKTEWHEVSRAFPDQSNESARKLEYFAAELGINYLASTEPSRLDLTSPEIDAIRAKNNDSWKAEREILVDYIKTQEKKVDDNIHAIPKELQDYLNLHKNQIISIVNHINNSEPPVWGIDVFNEDQLPDFSVPLPSFLNLVDFQRLLILNALDDSLNQQYVEAIKTLSASLRLSFAIAQRPELISQLVAIIGINMHSNIIPNLDFLSSAWIDGMNIPDFQKTMSLSLKMEAFAVATTFGENPISHIKFGDLGEHSNESRVTPFVNIQRVFHQPLLKLASSDSLRKSIQKINMISNLPKSDLCFSELESTSTGSVFNQMSWNPLPTISQFYSQFDKVNELFLRWELARKVVRIKEKAMVANSFPRAPTGIAKSEVCPSLSWNYRVTDDGEMKIGLSQVPEWLHIREDEPPLEYRLRLEDLST